MSIASMLYLRKSMESQEGHSVSGTKNFVPGALFHNYFWSLDAIMGETCNQDPPLSIR